MTQNLISIILPIWNPKISDLKKCIDSVLSQTYSSFELIIAYKKNSETDESFHQLIKDYDDKRIRVIECTKKGISSQMNEGIKKSSGNLIARIDGDDFWDSKKLELQLEYKKNHQLDIVGTWGILISNEGKEIRKLEPPITHEEIRKNLMLNDTIIQPSILMDKKMFDDVGFFDESFTTAEDYEMWFRIISKGYKFGNLPKYIIFVTQNPTSASRINWKRNRVDTVRAKNMAIKKYGFIRLRDFLYYLPTPMYYFISPNNAKRIRKILGISRHYDE